MILDRYHIINYNNILIIEDDSNINLILNYIYDLLKNENERKLQLYITDTKTKFSFVHKIGNINIFSKKEIEKLIKDGNLENLEGLLVFFLIDDLLLQDYVINFFKILKQLNRKYIIITKSPIFLPSINLPLPFSQLKEKILDILNINKIFEWESLSINNDFSNKFNNELENDSFDSDYSSTTSISDSSISSTTDSASEIINESYIRDKNDINSESQTILNIIESLLIKSKYNRNEISEEINQLERNINNNFNVNCKNKNGETPLILFCKAKEDFLDKFINILIIKGCDVNSRDNKGNTPLIYCCENNKINVVDYLIANNANIECYNNEKRTPLIVASKNQNFEIIQKLIKIGAKINVKDKYGNNVLHYTCQNQDFLCTKKLLDGIKEQGQQVLPMIISINNENKSPLLLSIENPTIFNLFLDYGEDIYEMINSKTDNKSVTIIEKIIENNNKAILEHTLNHINKLDDDIKSKINHEIINIVFRKIEINTQKKDILDIIKILIENNDKNTNQSLLDYTSNIEIKDYLISQNLINDSFVILNYELWNGNKNNYLKIKDKIENMNKNEKNMIINKINYRGQTPLITLIISNYTPEQKLNLVKTLIENGANVNLTDKEGKSPIKYSIDENDENIFQCLIDNGVEVNEEILDYANKNNSTLIKSIKNIINKNENSDSDYLIENDNQNESNIITINSKRKYTKKLSSFIDLEDSTSDYSSDSNAVNNSNINAINNQSSSSSSDTSSSSDESEEMYGNIKNESAQIKSNNSDDSSSDSDDDNESSSNSSNDSNESSESSEEMYGNIKNESAQIKSNNSDDDNESSDESEEMYGNIKNESAHIKLNNSDDSSSDSDDDNESSDESEEMYGNIKNESAQIKLNSSNDSSSDNDDSSSDSDSNVENEKYTNKKPPRSVKTDKIYNYAASVATESTDKTYNYAASVATESTGKTFTQNTRNDMKSNTENNLDSNSSNDSSSYSDDSSSDSDSDVVNEKSTNKKAPLSVTTDKINNYAASVATESTDKTYNYASIVSTDKTYNYAPSIATESTDKTLFTQNTKNDMKTITENNLDSNSSNVDSDSSLSSDDKIKSSSSFVDSDSSDYLGHSNFIQESFNKSKSKANESYSLENSSSTSNSSEESSTDSSSSVSSINSSLSSGSHYLSYSSNSENSLYHFKSFSYPISESHSINSEEDIINYFEYLNNKKENKSDIFQKSNEFQNIHNNHHYIYKVSEFFYKNFYFYYSKFYAINYFCNLLYSNFNMNSIMKSFSRDRYNRFETQNIYIMVKKKDEKDKYSKSDQITSMINGYIKNDKNHFTFLLFLNELYYLYDEIYQNLHNLLKSKKEEDYTYNIYFNDKFMIVDIVKNSALKNHIISDTDKINYDNIIVIISEDIYRVMKKHLIKEKIELPRFICLSFQDSAIDFYSNYQKFFANKFILNQVEIENDKNLFIVTNYGLKLSYELITKKFIDEIKINRSLKKFDSVEDYISKRNKKMEAELIKFIDNIIYNTDSLKHFTSEQKLYCVVIKITEEEQLSDILGNKNKIYGPLCSSKSEAEKEANLLLFKLLYHCNFIKLPLIEAKFNSSVEEFQSSSYESISKNSNNENLIDDNLRFNNNSTYNCPNVFSNDLWELELAPSNNFYNLRNRFFVTYFEIDNSGINNESEKDNDFKYDDLNTNGEINNKIDLCLGLLTKKPIPVNGFPIVDVNEYKNEKHKFKLNAWNRCPNNNLWGKLNSPNTEKNKNNYVLDNSECQSYLPVNFSDEEYKKIKKFQENTWRLLYGNSAFNPKKTEEMYYIIPMYKNRKSVDINWDIINNINSISNTEEENKNNITLGDWICYANYFINKENKEFNYENSSFEERFYHIQKFHKDINDNPSKLKNLHDQYKENQIDNKTQTIINESLKKTYLVNIYDKTICNFLSIYKNSEDKNVYISNELTINRKLETPINVTYQSFFKEKYKLKNDYKYKHENLPLFTYDAHALIHNLSRDDKENVEKKNLYIPEFFNVILVPQVWIKILPLIPILIYKIKIYCFMDELRYQIGLKYLTVGSLYRASMSKSSDPIVGEQHERLEMIGDSILKYFSTVNILNCYFNRNEDFLIRKRNEFIKNEFLRKLIIDLGWKKYLIQQRFSVKNFNPPGIDAKQQQSSIEPSKDKQGDDKGEKPIADFYEALIGACFEDGILSHFDKNKKRTNYDLEILKLDDNRIPLNEKINALEYGINLCKLFLICSKSIITDHWKWKPSLNDNSVRKTSRKSIRKVADKMIYDKLREKLRDDSALFSVVNYSKDTYSDFNSSDCKRLKFIGEAVLDLITVIHFYITRKDASPKELTEYKHMAVTKNSYAILFTDLDIFYKLNADEKIKKEYKRAKHQKNKDNLPKYFSEIFEVLIGSIYIDTDYKFGRTNYKLFNLLNESLYKKLEKQKSSFKAINSCIEIIQSILKEQKDKERNEINKDLNNKEFNNKKFSNQQVTFETSDGKMFLVVKNFDGKKVKFNELSVPESNNSKRKIAKNILEIRDKISEIKFKEKIIERIKTNENVTESFWDLP